ncbi:hypothetical protein Tco_0599356 [Tanacetum coccineum]
MKMQKASSAQQSIGYVTFTNRIEKSQDIRNCLICMFFSLKKNPRTYYQQALQDESWVEAMQEELLQFITTRIGVGFLLICHMGKKLTATSPFESNKPLVKFWTIAKSRTVNNISYIDATVARKPVTISEASIRSDLIFDDANGIDSLNNQAIFDNIQLMGNQLKDVPVPLDHFPVPTLTKKVLTFMVKKGKNFSGKRVLVGIMEVTSQAKDIKALKAQGRKSVKTFKGKPSVHIDPSFDDLNDFVDVDDTLDYMDTKDVQDERTNKGTADQNKGKNATQTAPTTTSTPTPTIPTPTVFDDDETIAQVLIIMSQNKEKLKEKEKGVEIRNVEETERPRPTSTRSILTLRPLPKINPKDKGKNRIEEEDESDTKSKGITEAKKKFKQLANDEEVARKVQEEWEAEEENKRLAKEEPTKAALSNEYDFIQARLNADKILAEKLQEE